jgi:hypothetical protein
MSRQIQTHDIVVETRRLDLRILNRTGAYFKAVNLCLILTEGLKIEENWADISARLNFHFQNQEGYATPKAGKPLDTCLRAITHRQALRLHKATYQNQETGRWNSRCRILLSLAVPWLWAAAK